MKTNQRRSLIATTLLTTCLISMQIFNPISSNAQTDDKTSSDKQPTEIKTAKTETISPVQTTGTTIVANPIPNSATTNSTLKNNDSASKGKPFVATTYCLKGRTAMGTGVQRGIIAADPRILPLGSRVQLSAGRYSGSYLVTDTGSAIKGRRIDIWVPSCGEARSFGRRTVYVAPVGRKPKN